MQADAALSEWSSFITERKLPHRGDNLVSHLAALHLQCGPVLSQVLPGDRTFTPGVFKHYNIVMPSDSVGPDPQNRWAEKAVQTEPVWGQSTARKLGPGRMALGAQGAGRERGMGAAEAAWQQCLHPPASTSSTKQHPMCPHPQEPLLWSCHHCGLSSQWLHPADQGCCTLTSLTRPLMVAQQLPTEPEFVAVVTLSWFDLEIETSKSAAVYAPGGWPLCCSCCGWEKCVPRMGILCLELG